MTRKLSEALKGAGHETIVLSAQRDAIPDFGGYDSVIVYKAEHVQESLAKDI